MERKCPVCNSEAGTAELYRQSHAIIQCDQCRLVYAWPRETSSTLYESAYTVEGAYYKYLPDRQRNVTLHATWAMREFLKEIKPTGRLLDIGCSTGTFLLLAQQEGWDVVGVEVSEKAASIARDLTGAAVFVGTIADLNSDEPFDVITIWETLEHVPDPVRFLRGAVNLLRSGGVLALSVPNWASPWMRRSINPEHWPPYHLTFWDQKTLWALLKQVNLKDPVVRAKPFAWEEELGEIKWAYLPIALLRSVILQQKGMHLYAAARKI